MSRWTAESRRVINATLDAMPAAASERECLAALTAAYPFELRENHPYACWCKEVKAALNRRFAAKKHAKQDMTPQYLITRRGGRMWLAVACPSCRLLNLLNGCLQCRLMHDALPEHVADAQFQALARAAVTDDVALYALLDFCEEQLGIRPDVFIEAALTRKKQTQEGIT